MARLFRWAALLFVCTFLTLSCMAPAHATGDAKKFTGWWELGGYYGTDDASRGEAVLFTPLMQSATTLFFLDARGKLFEDDVQEGNIALGYRQMMSSGWNLGVWGGWDIRDTTNDNTFNQISFGLEALSERYDLRVNGYVPLEDSETVTNTNSFDALLQGNNIFVQQTNTLIRELAFYGVDAEFGVLLFGGNRGGGGGLKGAPAPLKRHELRAYAGGFWFDHDDADDAIAGPKGRLEYRINDVVSGLPGSRLTLESEFSYDEVRDTKFEIGARLRIPFGSRGGDAASRTAALTGQELRMMEGLERDTDIVTDEQTDTTITTEGAIDDATGVALNSVSFAQSASAFKKAVDAGGNRLIILRKGDQRIDVSSTEGQPLQDNQTVQGGASTILIRGKKSGEVVPFTAPGKRPTVFTNDINFDTGAITLANNTHVAGLNIRGVGGQNTQVVGNIGLRGLSDLDNIVIEQSDIRETGYDAILFDSNNSDIRIHDTSISNTGRSGIAAVNGNLNLSVWNTQIADVRTDGIRFADNNTNLDLWKVNINGTSQSEGVQVGNNTRNLTIRDSVIKNTGEEAIFIDDFSRDIEISNVQVRNTGAEGIGFSSDHRNVALYDISIIDPAQEAIFIGSDNRNFTFKKIVVKRNGTGAAIDFNDDNRDFAFDEIFTQDTAAEGLEFGSRNINVTIRNTSIIDPGLDGIEFGDDNQNVKIITTKIINPDTEGIDFSNDNLNVLIADTTIEGGAQGMFDGIELTSRNTVTISNVKITGAGTQGVELLGNDNVVTLRDVTIADSGFNGIVVEGLVNTLSIQNSTIRNAGFDGLQVGGLFHDLTLEDTSFNGTFGSDVIDLDNTTYTLDGAGNTFTGTFGGQFCNSGLQTGSFGFDVGPQATCP